MGSEMCIRDRYVGGHVLAVEVGLPLLFEDEREGTLGNDPFVAFHQGHQ